MNPRDAYLGELEELTLLALLRRNDEPNGNDVREDLASDADRHVSPSTVYLTLMRLEEKGLCTSWIGEHEPVPGGRARRRYRILPEGVAALRRSHEIQRRMWRGFDALADRALNER